MMSKNICVVGTGYVGLLMAVGLADFGNTVVGVDIDKGKIDALKKGKPTIYEPGIEEYLNRNLESKRLIFTADFSEAINTSDVIFIAVGTPSGDEGEADLQQIYDVLKIIKSNINGPKVVAIKSTVPVGTNRDISRILNYDSIYKCDVVSNPEFLREGKAVYDFFHPDRIVIGSESLYAREVMEDVFRNLNRIDVPFVWCNWETAELIKYASNGFLALKIGYINQIACVAEETGADIVSIAKAMGMDGRIGQKFLHAGPGYGGSCFPKDTKALSMIGKKNGVPISLIDTVITANEEQKTRVYTRLKKRLGQLQGKTIGVLGLAFKAETDDIRESSAIVITRHLLEEGAKVQAHDPRAMVNFSKIFPEVRYMKTEYKAAENCDALLILTEWNEYRSLNLMDIKKVMKNPYIFDTRSIINETELDRLGFSYDFIGRKGK